MYIVLLHVVYNVNSLPSRVILYTVKCYNCMHMAPCNSTPPAGVTHICKNLISRIVLATHINKFHLSRNGGSETQLTDNSRANSSSKNGFQACLSLWPRRLRQLLLSTSCKLCNIYSKLISLRIMLYFYL